MAIYLVDAGQDIMIEIINGGGHPANFISVFISTIPAVPAKVAPDFRIGTMTEWFQLRAENDFKFEIGNNI